MTRDEVLKQALKALEHAAYCVQKNYCPDKMGHDWDDTITAIKEALAQPVQATSGWSLRYVYFDEDGIPLMYREPEERYFCQRCGKRTADPTTIHTCTPPLPVQESEPPAGQPLREPVATISITRRGSSTTIDNHFEDCVRDWPEGEYKLVLAPPLPLQPEERYFCQRCGKPVNLTTIHTCTPPT
jgi:hypothetical protein